MALEIATLPVIPADYDNRGPGLHPGLSKIEAMLEQGREGYFVVNVSAGGATIPVVLARSDLYLTGFQCAGGWLRFDDAAWPFSDAVTKLGFEGGYWSLGGLTGGLSANSIKGIARLASYGNRPQWKDSLRTLVIVLCECARLIPVRMQVLGLLNGVVDTIPLAPLAHYIRNWDKASKGMDMSVQAGPNLRTGFSNPVIIKR